MPANWQPWFSSSCHCSLKLWPLVYTLIRFLWLFISLVNLYKNPVFGTGLVFAIFTSLEGLFELFWGTHWFWSECMSNAWTSLFFFCHLVVADVLRVFLEVLKWLTVYRKLVEHHCMPWVDFSVDLWTKTQKNGSVWLHSSSAYFDLNKAFNNVTI